MKTLYSLLMMVVMLTPAQAHAWSLGQIGDKTGAYLLGFVSGYLAHEAGHVIVATAKGYDVDLDGVSIIYPDAQMSDADRLQVSSAGFQAQWLTTEASFLYRSRKELSPTSDNFTAGLISSHLVITAAYLTVLRDHPQGDTYAMSEATDLSTGQIAALLAVPAVLDTWRLFGEDVPKWVPALSVGYKGAGFVAIWTY